MMENTAEPFVEAVRNAIDNAAPVNGYGAGGTADEAGPGWLERTENRHAELKVKIAELDEMIANTFMSLTLKGDELVVHKGQTFPIAGVKATIESSGIARSRMTATRVIGGAALFGGTGAVIGTVGRKDQSTIFLTIELADGTVLVEEFPAKKEGDARRFIAKLNTAAAHAQRSEPIPQPVEATQPVPQVSPPAPAPVIAQGPPPGWYADPHGTPNTRWWGGTIWTEHLQPTIQQ